MIRYGLKLWTKNEPVVFREAAKGYTNGRFDFIELYHHPDQSFDEAVLALLSGIPVTIHNTHDRGFHEFVLGEEQLKIWEGTLKLADWFKTDTIVVHPGKKHTVKSFALELAKIDDQRIIVENMAGLDLFKDPMFAQKIEELVGIKAFKPFCFDFEKAIKAAAWQKKDYQEYIQEALKKLQPTYFHISGGDKDSPVDQHEDITNCNFDVAWIKKQLVLLSIEQDVRLVFETPRRSDNLINDYWNMDFFRNL